jgi:hypothetical protein
MPSERGPCWMAGSLLNTMGRAVLVNAVLDSQLVYALCAMQIPLWTITSMDRRRRSFLWSGDQTISGANSLVAWEKICWLRDHRGLGIKDLSLMNVCLMLKLLHRLHVADDSAWASWARLHTSLANLDGDLSGLHWDVLRGLLPLYQAVTSVTVGDGTRTIGHHSGMMPGPRMKRSQIACQLFTATVFRRVFQSNRSWRLVLIIQASGLTDCQCKLRWI